MEPTEENRRAWDAIHRSAAGAEPRLPEEVVRRLPELRDKHVLQLHGDAGAARELRALGALVTVVTPEPDTVDDVREHAEGAAAVNAEPDELPLELRRGRFDVVYAAGVLPEVRDLAGFAAGVAGALRSGGVLALQDDHPVSLCLDDAELAWREDYFRRTWPLGRLVTALVEAGLVLRAIDEFPSLYRWKLRNRHVPSDLLVVAQKP